MEEKKLTMLMILDGFGSNTQEEGNAVNLANTPNIDTLMKTYPITKINASGLAVGLPEGQMGNSEVGHTNIGAGRIVYQDLSKMYKEQVQLGYSKMLPQIALGHSQSSIINTAYFENEILKLHEIMIPNLMSSTMSAEQILGTKD